MVVEPSQLSLTDRDALRALADALALPQYVSIDTGVLVELADGAAPTCERLSGCLTAVREIIPGYALLALRALRVLSAVAGAISDRLEAEIWLALAQAHALRREGREAIAAATAARTRFSVWKDAANVAQCNLVAGIAAMALGRYEETATLLESARSACEQLQDRAGQAEAALQLAHYHAELTHFAEALALAQEAAALTPDDPWRVCRARIQIADAWFSQTRYPDAAAAYAELTPLCQEHGWRLDDAHVRLMQGLLATQQGDFDAAGAYLNAALAVYTAEETVYYVAVCQRGLAMLFRRQGRYEEALASIQTALETFQALAHPVAVGRCYHALGLIHYAWNRYDAAAAAYEEALARYQAADLPHEQIAVRLNLALILEERGHYHAALARHEQALHDSRSLGLTSIAAQCLENIAVLNGRLGRYPEAIAYYRQARRAFHSLRADFDAQVCAARQASILHLMGQGAAARRLLNTVRRYLTANDNQAPLAFCELTLGEVAAGRGQNRAALAHYGAALEILTRYGQDVDAALCRLRIGEAHLNTGAAAAALEPLHAAADLFSGNFPDLAARVEHALGRAAKMLGDERAAAVHWQAAVGHVGVARHGIVTESHAGSFFEGRRWIYEDALVGWLALGDAAAALTVVEASKGQVLASLLQQRDVLSAVFGGQSPETRALWEKSWAVNRELDALRARWPAAEAGGTRSLTALNDALKRVPTDAGSRLARLATEQAELFERIRRSAASVELLDPHLPFALEPFRAAMSQVHGADWDALAYFLRPDSVVIFWITATTVQAWAQPLSRLALVKLRQVVDPAAEQRELIYAGRLNGRPHADPPGPRLLRSVADLLIPAEARSALAPGRPLLIAPHGLLHYLPFQALLLNDDRPLLEHATVSYAPTLRVWQALQERRATLTRSAGAETALVCGVRDFGRRAPELPYAETEAQRVDAQFGDRAVLLLGASVTADRLLAWGDDGTLSRFGIIHLATHAVFDAAQPVQSRILFADAALSVPELFRLRLNARLMTLSACQTALSALKPGDELLGLREALLFAGANALLVSLWPVEDASTARLMQHFYRHLDRDMTPAAALAAAQREMCAAGECAYHWAPFVVIG